MIYANDLICKFRLRTKKRRKETIQRMKFPRCQLQSLDFNFLVLHEVVTFYLYHDRVERGAVEHAL